MQAVLIVEHANILLRLMLRCNGGSLADSD